jgi:hypothetical protein
MSLLLDYWRLAYGNVAAEPLCVLLAAAVAFLFRDLIGRKAAAWWHKHHGHHLRGELAAIERRLTAEADTRHTILMKQLGADHEDLKRHVTKETK